MHRVAHPALAGLLAAALAPGAHAAPLAERPGQPSGIEAPPSTGHGGTLDRTLQVDTEAAQRDVEILMQTRSTAEGDPPPAGRPLSGSPAPAAASAARATGVQAADNPAAVRTAANPIPEPVRELMRILREHRFWLLGALGLCVVAMVGGQLWQRRRAGASERRLRELAGQPRSSRGRRRASRH